MQKWLRDNGLGETWDETIAARYLYCLTQVLLTNPEEAARKTHNSVKGIHSGLQDLWGQNQGNSMTKLLDNKVCEGEDSRGEAFASCNS